MTQDSDLAPSGKALKQVHMLPQSFQALLSKHSLYYRSSHATVIQAASWLGVSDPVKLLDDDSAADAFQPRPEGLGLGARFLPHHKVQQPYMTDECQMLHHPFRCCSTVAQMHLTALQLYLCILHCAGCPLDNAIGEAVWKAFAALNYR